MLAFRSGCAWTIVEDARESRLRPGRSNPPPTCDGAAIGSRYPESAPPDAAGQAGQDAPYHGVNPRAAVGPATECDAPPANVERKGGGCQTTGRILATGPVQPADSGGRDKIIFGAMAREAARISPKTVASGCQNMRLSPRLLPKGVGNR